MASNTTPTTSAAERLIRRARSAGTACLITALLAACGSGGSGNGSAEQATTGDTSMTTVDEPLAPIADSTEYADVEVVPTFHRQAAALDEPDDSDADGSGASAATEPKSVPVQPALAGLDTKQLTDERIDAWLASPASADEALKAASSVPVVYTPAQIRAAYRLPVLPATTAGLSTQAAVALGAGQTLYIVGAYHNPNTASDLQKFSQKFGLPQCTTVAAPRNATRLAAPATNSGCTFMTVYSGAGATVSSKAPAYNAGWAGEIALDVQWAHAIAPLARIVLIEAPSATVGALSDAIRLATTLGPGVVSMSFGAIEGSWVNSANTVFQGSGMTYLAATGDSGYAVSWPSVAPNVVAVGGTTLTYTSAGTRAEVAWSKTGGGLSAFVARPAYQQSLSIAGQTATTARFRGVADLSMNADPYTGQYVAITPPGSRVTSWYSFGGTSMSTPQLAGLVAVANAQRALKNLAPLGIVNTALYANLAPNSSAYAQSLNDVTSGRNGGCSSCLAARGYDIPTGLGTPRADYFLSAMTAR